MVEAAGLLFTRNKDISVTLGVRSKKNSKNCISALSRKRQNSDCDRDDLSKIQF
jgi:hypothetical protein